MTPQPPPGSEMVFGIFPFYFVYTLVIILVVALIFYWLIKNGCKKTPLELLKKRYASGEIDSETYREMKEDLAEKTRPE